MERLERLGVWCPEVSFFHAFHDFQGVQNRFWNQVPRACFWCPGAPFFHAFHAFHVVRGSLLDPAPRARSWCPGAPFFHAFQVGFLGPPNTPLETLETLESVEMVEATCPAKRPAFEGRWFFLCGLVVDATTRSDTTCSRRWGQTTDLSARLADSASQGGHLQSALLTRPNGQLTRAGQFYHSITGRCDSCGTSIAGREPASGLTVAAALTLPPSAPPSPSLRSRCSLAGALQSKQVAPHSRCSAPGLPVAAAPQALTVAAAPQVPLTVAAARQAPHSGCSPPSPHSRCTVVAPPRRPHSPQTRHSGCSPQSPQAPSQSLQPPSQHSPVVAAPQALTVAAASRASLLLFSPDPRGWVRTAGGEDRG